MYERKNISVPPVDEDLELSNGKRMNVVIGNVSDPINLTYGERTGACMRIGGHADSLFDFCLKDDNCFHIRFSSQMMMDLLVEFLVLEMVIQYF